MDWPAMRTNPLPADPLALERAAAVKLMIFDVDGVLTDGGLHLGPDGAELFKRFDTLDGHGLKLLAEAGVVTAIISGRKSEIVAARAAALGVSHVYQGQSDKRGAFAELLGIVGVKPRETGYMGDDWPDLPLLTRVGFAACPTQAHAEVKARCHYVAKTGGGAGAAREVCDLILTAQDRYGELLAQALGKEAH